MYPSVQTIFPQDPLGSSIKKEITSLQEWIAHPALVFRNLKMSYNSYLFIKISETDLGATELNQMAAESN